MPAPLDTAPPPPTRPRAPRIVAGLLGLLIGSLAVNGVPHLVQGLAGNVFQTPFGAGSSATVNLVWGAANLVLAAGTAFLARRRMRNAGFVPGLAIGVLATAASLLVVFA